MNLSLGHQAFEDGGGFLPAQNEDLPFFSGVFQSLYKNVQDFTDN